MTLPTLARRRSQTAASTTVPAAVDRPRHRDPRQVRRWRRPVTAAIAVAVVAVAVAVAGPGGSTADASTAPYARLAIPSLKVDAPVYTVGATNGTLHVPSSPSALGRYEKSAAFGDVLGDMAIGGHVSDTKDRPGALYKLRTIKVGATIRIKRGNETTTFKVTSVKTHPRSKPLPTGTFRHDGPARLVLISCTNKVTTSSGFHYRDNLIVTATRSD